LEDASDNPCSITAAILDEALNKLCSGKATGVDGLPDIHLKHLPPAAKSKILATFDNWL